MPNLPYNPRKKMLSKTAMQQTDSLNLTTDTLVSFSYFLQASFLLFLGEDLSMSLRVS